MNRVERPVQPEIIGSKETEKKPQFDTIIVFGQGPVKEIKTFKELTPDEKSQWEKFVKDPRTDFDPDFYAIDKDLTDEERERLQHLGRFALKRLGRLNALAAGYALVTGQTKELILSGGHTQSEASRLRMEKNLIKSYEKKDQKDKIEEYANLSQAQKNTVLDDFAAKEFNRPSEGELIWDIIDRRYYEDFKRKYIEEHPGLTDMKSDEVEKLIREEWEGKKKIEARSTNTLENLALTIDENPDIFSKKVGLLSVNHHLRRILLLANRFGIDSTKDDEISAQMELEERARGRAKKAYEKLVQTKFREEYKLEKGENRWIAGLEDPQFINYWVGYISEIKDPAVVQRIIGKMNSPEWIHAIRNAFSQVGLDFAEFEHEDLIKLQKEDPAKYTKFRNQLSSLLRFRTLPPEL